MPSLHHQCKLSSYFTKNPYHKRQRNHCVDNGCWNSKFVKNSNKKFALLHVFLTSICKPLNFFFVPFLLICTLYAFFFAETYLQKWK